MHNPAENINLYGNYSTHFETPTLNELSNNPDPSSNGGFNSELNPQYAKNIELGVKGFFNKNLFIEMAAFKIDALYQTNNGVYDGNVLPAIPKNYYMENYLIFIFLVFMV